MPIAAFSGGAVKSIKDDMERIYREIPPHEIPWNFEAPPDLLKALVTDHVLEPCRVVELGCGTGNYVRYFSMNGFDATGVDISEAAIRIARRAALTAGVTCRFVVADVLGDLAETGDPFDFAYDWEVLHHIFPEDRGTYIDNVWKLLKPEGRYLSVSFSEDSPGFGGVGKYRRTPLGTVLYFSGEAELESLLSRRFVVEDLKSIELKGKNAPHKAIYAFSRKLTG